VVLESFTVNESFLMVFTSIPFTSCLFPCSFIHEKLQIRSSCSPVDETKLISLQPFKDLDFEKVPALPILWSLEASIFLTILYHL